MHEIAILTSLILVVFARVQNMEASACSVILAQIGTHCALWWYVSFLLFWLVDVLDSVRLNRGGKVRLEAGVCGCRVGFNGERIHFGSSGCRCVGGNENRGIIDCSEEMAAYNACVFAEEIIAATPGEILKLVCIVCSGVRNIVRVSLAFSIAKLAYVVLKVIEMCSLFSRVLHESDKCPALSYLVLGLCLALAEYSGEEKRASIVCGFVFVKYPYETVYNLCFMVYFICILLKRLLIQWPLTLVKSLTRFVGGSGGQLVAEKIGEELEESGNSWLRIVLKLPSKVDGVMRWQPVVVGIEEGESVTVDMLQRFCCSLLPGVLCSSQIRLLSGGRLLAGPEDVLELKSGQTIYCSLELRGGMFGRGPPQAWDISPPGRRFVAQADFGTPGVDDEQARRARQERAHPQDTPAAQGSPSAENMVDAISARVVALGNELKAQLREEHRRESIAMVEMLRRESNVTFQPISSQRGPVRYSLMEQREHGTVPSKVDTEPSIVKSMDLYLGNKADPPSQMPDLKGVQKLEERLVAISAWLVAFERYVKSSLSVTDIAEGHDLQEASEELWGLVMQGITDWTSSWVTREGSLKQGQFTLACTWDGGAKGLAYTKWAFRVCNTVVATLGNLQADFDNETAFFRLSPLQIILATPIYLLKVHGIKKAEDVTYLCRKIDNPHGWLVNRDGTEFDARLRRWAALSDAFDRLVPPILQQAGGDRAPKESTLLDSLRSIVSWWLKVISEHHKSELNDICNGVHLFQPFETTEDAAQQVKNAVLALASV